MSKLRFLILIAVSLSACNIADDSIGIERSISSADRQLRVELQGQESHEEIARRILADARFNQLVEETKPLHRRKDGGAAFGDLVSSERHISTIRKILKESGVNRTNSEAVRSALMRILAEEHTGRLVPSGVASDCATMYQAIAREIYAEYMFDVRSCRGEWFDLWNAFWGASVCMPAAEFKAQAAYDANSTEYHICLEG